MTKRKIVAVSDLHEQWNAVSIPKGDLLLVAGDLTYNGNMAKIIDFNRWAKDLKDNGIVSDVIAIAGNHDLTAARSPALFRTVLQDVTYLCDEEVERLGLRIYGSPWTPSFFREHWVFNADRGHEIRQHWEKIPAGLDILITHGPAYDACDRTVDGRSVGCVDLRWILEDRKPKVHICGHIHHGYGQTTVGETMVINASTCTEHYKPRNAPIVFEI